MMASLDLRVAFGTARHADVERIHELRSSFNGEYLITLNDKTRLTLSRGYREGLQVRLGKTL